MRTTVNPGRYLQLEASLQLDLHETTVIDRESGQEVTLADLLRSFREDPSDNVIGRVTVTIEPAR